jgi:hypothetical protein
MNNIDNIYVFDDIIPEGHSKYLEKLYTGPNISWDFQKDITFYKDGHDGVVDYNPGFSNLIYDKISNTNSDLIHTALPIMYGVLEKINREIIHIMKIRSFLQLPQNGQNNKVNNPHIDAEIDHLVILYYVNDSDGDTILYNETEKSEEYTIQTSVKPKRGRCVVFPGKYYHSSSQPTNNIRGTININILI